MSNHIKTHNSKLKNINNATITGHNNVIYGSGNTIIGHNNKVYGRDNEFVGHNNQAYNNYGATQPAKRKESRHGGVLPYKEPNTPKLNTKPEIFESISYRNEDLVPSSSSQSTPSYGVFEILGDIIKVVLAVAVGIFVAALELLSAIPWGFFVALVAGVYFFSWKIALLIFIVWMIFSD